MRQQLGNILVELRLQLRPAWPVRLLAASKQRDCIAVDDTVRAARENHDICIRLKDDLDKARKEYDRRFKALQDQPVDYFYDWMVAILADGDPEALGAYPYPSPVRR